MDTADLEGQVKDISPHEIENVDAIEAVLFIPEEKALVRKIDLTLLPTILGYVPPVLPGQN